MRVKFKADILVSGKHYDEAEVAELSDSDGKAMIRLGRCDATTEAVHPSPKAESIAKGEPNPNSPKK